MVPYVAPRCQARAREAGLWPGHGEWEPLGLPATHVSSPPPTRLLSFLFMHLLLSTLTLIPSISLLSVKPSPEPPSPGSPPGQC